MSSDNSICANGGYESLPDWIKYGGFLLSVLSIVIIFWAFAFICEEYCIPAITILCKRNKISDDIAGAIFIGAGLSSPPLFAALIGLFLSNSAIGVGTVVGGDIFNHLINMSASIIVAPTRSLQLDGVGLTREVIFYFSSLIVIIWSVKGNIYPAIVETFDTRTWTDCVSITWIQSLVPVVLYGIYCLNVVYLPHALNYFIPSLQAAHQMPIQEEESFRENATEDEMNLADQYNDPFTTGDSEGYIRLNPNNLPEFTPATSIVEMIQMERNPAYRSSNLNNLDRNINNNDNSNNNNSNNPVNIHSEDDVERQNYPYTKESKVFSGHDMNSDFPLYKKSDFYTKYDFGCVPRSRQWKLRHFSANVYGLYYRLTEDQPKFGSHIRFINLFEASAVEVIDHNTLEFHIRMRAKGKKYKFQAVDLTTFEKLVLFVNKFIMHASSKSPEERSALAAAAILAVSGGTGVVSSPDIESADEQMFLVPSTKRGKFIYYLTLPWRYMMFFTIPDVRKRKYKSRCLLSIFNCIAWLFAYSYLLLVSLNVIASVLKVNGTILGYTVGAWAASYPALWSSVVLAKHGYGDMASCNALGSNTFTNFIGLGLPWLLYTIVHGGEEYNHVQDGGSVLSLLLLAIILILYYILLFFTKWKLHFWMVPIFLTAYVGILVYLIINSV